MSFVSDGTEQQVESAASTALATHHGVPLSSVTVDATAQSRRLMTARELTSSKSWTVAYLIVADESTIDRVLDSATELSDGANATALGSFADLLTTALSEEGVAVSASISVSFTAPQKGVVTAAVAVTAEEDVATTTEEPTDNYGVVVGITVSLVVVLCALAGCLVGYCHWSRTNQRAHEELQEIILDRDIPEISPSEAGPSETGSVQGQSVAGSDAGARGSPPSSGPRHIGTKAAGRLAPVDEQGSEARIGSEAASLAAVDEQGSEARSGSEAASSAAPSVGSRQPRSMPRAPGSDSGAAPVVPRGRPESSGSPQSEFSI
jgi:hypothetical protein